MPTCQNQPSGGVRLHRRLPEPGEGEKAPRTGAVRNSAPLCWCQDVERLAFEPDVLRNLGVHHSFQSLTSRVTLDKSPNLRGLVSLASN